MRPRAREKGEKRWRERRTEGAEGYFRDAGNSQGSPPRLGCFPPAHLLGALIQYLINSRLRSLEISPILAGALLQFHVLSRKAVATGRAVNSLRLGIAG